MEDAEKKFRDAVSYALKFVEGKKKLDLREQQIKALKSVYDMNDVFVWLPTGFYVMNLCLLCLTTNGAIQLLIVGILY